MSENMEVQVGLWDIVVGDKRNARDCPIARAVKRGLGDDRPAWVSENRVEVKWGSGVRLHHTGLRHALFVRDFDTGSRAVFLLSHLLPSSRRFTYPRRLFRER